MSEAGEVETKASSEDEKVVRREVERVRGFVKDLSMEDLRQGNWFAKLLTFSLNKYVEEVDAEYSRRKYPDLPADAVVRERIQMAARYAGVEGGLSAAAYTGAVAATISSGGGASPLTLPAGGASFAVDLVYTSQLQLRLAHDIAVLYRVPLDMDDPDDLWKLIRIAFAIKSGEAGGGAVLKGVPVVVRPVVKKFFSGSTLAAARSLPVVGRHLLQRNVIKFAIPVVGVPLSVGVNYWTTRTAGNHALEIFRNEARLVESASRIVESAEHHGELPWIMWAAATSDGPATSNQHGLLNYVSKELRARGTADAELEELRDVIEIDRDRVWRMLEDATGDLEPLHSAAVTTVSVRGKASKKSLMHLERVAAECGVDHDSQAVRAQARSWS